MYTYIKNQYLLGNFTKEDLSTLVTKGRITDAQRLEIIRTLDPDYVE
jgi:uncharacterized XkdX family phage protein